MRLIDAYPVQEMLFEAIDKVTYLADKERCKLFLRLITEQPTIDAVPVVRCGECREYRNGDCYHPLAYGMGGMLRGLEPTDFCSYGERRMDGE